MEIKKLACELESWAQEKGWKTVTQLITPHHFGDLLQPLDNVTDPDEYARRLHNNKQIIQRAFRNDTPNYLKQAEALSYAIRAAIDNELAQKDCMHYRMPPIFLPAGWRVCANWIRNSTLWSNQTRRINRGKSTPTSSPWRFSVSMMQYALFSLPAPEEPILTR